MHPTGNLVADTICRTAEIGLAITDAADAGPITIINATPVAVDDQCPVCGNCGTRRDHVTRRLVDLPVVGFPTRLRVRVPRFTCTNITCGRKIFQASLACADDGAKLTHRVTRWILQRLAVDRMSVAATAKALGVGWELVNRVAVTAARNLVYTDPTHLAGVQILGVDEHVWKHTRRPGEPSSMVTVLVDLTPLADGEGPARLIDMRPGRSAEVLKTWLTERDPQFRAGVQVVTSGTGSPGTPPPSTTHFLQRGRSWTHSMSSTWPPRSSPDAGNACSVKPPDGADGRTTRCTSTAECC